MFFVVVEDLLHRLELTMHYEGLQAQAHIVDVQARLLRVDVSDLYLYLVDPQIAEERLELLIFLAYCSFLLVLLFLLFTLAGDSNLVIAQVEYFLLLFRISGLVGDVVHHLLMCRVSLLGCLRHGFGKTCPGN